ncbi:MAG: TraR/DksA C4-type zinc finger protein [Pseudomonadota bacterium]
MEAERVAGFQARLESMLSELRAAEAGTAADRDPVVLDQQSVGRLSRMDALQMQAMAKAQSRRRAAEGERIRAALARIAAGEFGECLDCGEEIAVKRLELDPAVALCVTCAAG